MRNEPVNGAPFRLICDVEFGHVVVVRALTNLYRCAIWSHGPIRPFVEIQRDVVVGQRCKIKATRSSVRASRFTVRFRWAGRA